MPLTYSRGVVSIAKHEAKPQIDGGYAEHSKLDYPRKYNCNDPHRRYKNTTLISIVLD